MKTTYPKWATIGSRVVFRCDMVTKGGTEFKAGEEAEIRRRFRGLELRTDDGRRINRVYPRNVSPVICEVNNNAV